MAVQGIELIWVVVKNFKEALKFYTEIVGLKVQEINEQFGWAELAGSKGIRLGIAQMNDLEAIQPGQNAVVTLSVANLEESKKALVQKGVKMVGEILDIPGHVKMQTITDADGNHFQLVESYT